MTLLMVRYVRLKKRKQHYSSHIPDSIHLPPHWWTTLYQATSTSHEVWRACVFPCRSCHLERTAWQYFHHVWFCQIPKAVEITLF